jgi:hypothetical protein
MAAPLNARVLARHMVWRPSPEPQYCDWCDMKYDGPECPECGDPAFEVEVGQVIVAFATLDGRRWVVWATRGADGRWEAERVLPAGHPLAAELAVAS